MIEAAMPMSTTPRRTSDARVLRTAIAMMAAYAVPARE
jgi:hypothetical protein